MKLSSFGQHQIGSFPIFLIIVRSLTWCWRCFLSSPDLIYSKWWVHDSAWRTPKCMLGPELYSLLIFMPATLLYTDFDWDSTRLKPVFIFISLYFNLAKILDSSPEKKIWVYKNLINTPNSHNTLYKWENYYYKSSMTNSKSKTVTLSWSAETLPESMTRKSSVTSWSQPLITLLTHSSLTLFLWKRLRCLEAN